MRSIITEQQLVRIKLSQIFIYFLNMQVILYMQKIEVIVKFSVIIS